MSETVSSMANKYKQPANGFLPVDKLNVVRFNDNYGFLTGNETIKPNLVGLAVDYLTRFTLNVKQGIDVKSAANDAFSISKIGVDNLDILYKTKRYSGIFENKINDITCLDKKSIDAAIKLATFDVAYRISPTIYNEYRYTLDKITEDHIRIMVHRLCKFLVNPVQKGGLSLGFDLKDSFTDQIVAGDGDYLTNLGMFDSKVSKYSPTDKFTLQILIYYLMGLRSAYKDKFKKIEMIGLFYPRQNQLYYKNVSEISNSIKDKVNNDVIGYQD